MTEAKANAIKGCALAIVRENKRIQRLAGQDLMEMTPKQVSKLNADLSWAHMAVEMDLERLGVLLGHLKKEDLREFYQPSGFHKYKGIAGEYDRLVAM